MELTKINNINLYKKNVLFLVKNKSFTYELLLRLSKNYYLTESEGDGILRDLIRDKKLKTIPCNGYTMLGIN